MAPIPRRLKSKLTTEVLTRARFLCSWNQTFRIFLSFTLLIYVSNTWITIEICDNFIVCFVFQKNLHSSDRILNLSYLSKFRIITNAKLFVAILVQPRNTHRSKKRKTKIFTQSILEILQFTNTNLVKSYLCVWVSSILITVIL